MEQEWEHDEWIVYFSAIAVLLYLKVKDHSQTDIGPANSKLFELVMKARSPEDFHAVCAQWIHKLEPIKKTKGAK